ncbi:DUF3472 domain-containing protein [Olivibacter domesticus]|uniref:DUF5077 domain-containing protein n=1 Tax=Olivibacter domesticus TaxID=407022 RepID=A0A1H7YLD1_OLID1|nr:DUF3472 domain-containing protein [Olivibacter domesticus]SEM46795.1 protein of unknown function [Olivibacter domesticus]
MKRKIYVLFLSAFFTLGKIAAQQKEVAANAVIVPIGGNTWQVGKYIKEDSDIISEEGIAKWDNPENEFKTFIRLAKKGTLDVWLKASVDEPSNLTVNVGHQKNTINISNGNEKSIYLGEWNIQDTGYVAIHLKANKQVALRGMVSLIVAGSAIDAGTHFVKNNEGNFFYWGRRGPSTHLNYQTPKDKDIAYYYNEITVPKGNDVIGSYYMANGFSGGYFGMQVNSATERRILFSVWSPFKTDNPNEIPEDHKIKLLKKGRAVHTGEFGNEGAGGQSYLHYNWKAGTTYKFLLKGEPVANNYTNYTAWFFAPEVGQWQLIASFSRPQTNSWLTGFHSFLENFSPMQGIYERKVYFGNQWVLDNTGDWYQVNKAKFSADNTARVGYRLDYSGGTEQGRFYLHNFGFFDHYTPIGTVLERTLMKRQPNIDFKKLP